MSAFPSTLSAFCSGNVALSEVLTVLRADLSSDRRSIPENISLVDQAWRSGQVGDSAYRALRDTITGFDVDDGAGRQEWAPIRATRHTTPFEFNADTDHEAPTQFRPSSHSIRDGAARDVPAISIARNRSTGGLASWPDVPPINLGQGAVLKDRFILEEEIGRGGMGTVFKARDLRKEEAQDGDPFVAVKVLNEDFRRHPESFKALQREAKKSQSLAHPNVASVFDFDRDGSTVFLVMELLEGASLQALIETRAGRGLPRSEVLRIIHSAGAALAHAHKKGVIHSDFKPANVIRLFDGTVKVLDFGIARAFVPKTDGTSHTTRFDVSSLRAMTPAYASPEMLLGQPADPRDDVFGLACVTYELLAGRHPFGYSTAVMAQREGAKLIPIENVHRKTWRALQHAMAFSRSERTASVTEFLKQLEPTRRIVVRSAIGAAAAVLVVAAGAAVYFSAIRGRTAQEQTSPTVGMSGSSAATSEAIEVSPVAESPELPSTLAPAASPQPVPETYDPLPSTAVTSKASAPVREAEERATPAVATASAPKPARSEPSQRELSVNQVKERTISLARTGEVPDAIASLRELQTKLQGEDDPVVREASTAIAQAYARLAERAIIEGSYSSASALFTRASEMASDSSIYASRREQVQRIERLYAAFENGLNLSAESVREELTHIRESEGPHYYAVRAQLARVLAQTIEAQQRGSSATTAPLIHLAQDLFAGIPEIDALDPQKKPDG